MPPYSIWLEQKHPWRLWQPATWISVDGDREHDYRRVHCSASYAYVMGSSDATYEEAGY